MITNILGVRTTSTGDREHKHEQSRQGPQVSSIHPLTTSPPPLTIPHTHCSPFLVPRHCPNPCIQRLTHCLRSRLRKRRRLHQIIPPTHITPYQPQCHIIAQCHHATSLPKSARMAPNAAAFVPACKPTLVPCHHPNPQMAPQAAMPRHHQIHTNGTQQCRLHSHLREHHPPCPNQGKTQPN